MFPKSFAINCPWNFQKYISCRVRNKSFNSNEWLKRRETDIYLEKARIQNFRCRSAFKLLEIDYRYKLIKPGFKVLDVGAAPGSWSQVLAERTNSNQNDPEKEVGSVIAVDLQLIHPINGVTILSQMDFKKETTQQKIVELLGETEKFDFILSDMAPAATGVKSFDQERILNLVYPVILFSVKHLKLHGGCLIKVWDNNFDNLIAEVKRFFQKLDFVKPKATYTSSSEIYFLARDFLGLKN